MIPSLDLSLDSARRVQLEALGLSHPPREAVGKDAALEMIHRMGALQIDTINVVARSPYLVLWSRLGQDFRSTWLDELLDEGKLFEYWAHAACFLPIEDYPLFHHRMENSMSANRSAWLAAHQDDVERVKSRIEQEGEVRSVDFERTDGRKGSWWDWKVEKDVLEFLHTSGQVMIARRVNFQRVYNLRERILPGWEGMGLLSQDDAADALSLKAVLCLGVAPARWVPDYFRLPKSGMAKRLEGLAEAGRLLRARVEGFDQPWYVHPDQMGLVEEAQAGGLEPTLTTLLSPFDPLIWDRERVRQMFDFAYSIECYLPQAKRQYGYFNLPILQRGRLIGRLDPKAHRRDGIFEVRSLHLEDGVVLDEPGLSDLADCLRRVAAWHGTPQVRFGEGVSAGTAAALSERLV